MKPEAEPTTPRKSLASWVDERAAELADLADLTAAGVAPPTHCPTGLRRLDDLGLLELGVCTVILGHEGDGKSALGLALCEGAARAGYDVLAYWPEDPARFVADRVLAGVTGASATDLRRGRGSGGDLRGTVGAVPWAERVYPDTRRHTSKSLLAAVDAGLTPATRLVLVDYAQVLGVERGEFGVESTERVLSRFVWDLNEHAKEHGYAAVLLSQVRTEVKERGRRCFDSWGYRNRGATPNAGAVEGYRPMAGDGQWAPGALGTKARTVLSWFRPGGWLRQHGVDARDDRAELSVIKNNYGVSGVTVRLGWDGATARVYDPKEAADEALAGK